VFDWHDRTLILCRKSFEASRCLSFSKTHRVYERDQEQHTRSYVEEQNSKADSIACSRSFSSFLEFKPRKKDRSIARSIAVSCNCLELRDGRELITRSFTGLRSFSSQNDSKLRKEQDVNTKFMFEVRDANFEHNFRLRKADEFSLAAAYRLEHHTRPNQCIDSIMIG
jgi:hypothetical protein